MGKKRSAARRAAAAAAANTTCPETTPPVAAVPDDPALTAATRNFEREPPPAPTQPPCDAHMASSCLVPNTTIPASYTPISTTVDVSILFSNDLKSLATGFGPDERLGATTADPREPPGANVHHAPRTSSLASHTHVETTNDSSDPPTSTPRSCDAVNERENEEGARREGLGSVHGEYTPHAPHSPIHMHHMFPAASPPPFHDAPLALSAAHGSPLNVSAVAEQPDGPGHDSHAPFFTPIGPAATLAALAACIPVHGPPDIFLTAHVPILACDDSHLDAANDITDRAANPFVPPSVPQSTTRRVTTIEEIDEGLLAWIREDAMERGRQDGWDDGEMHGRAGGYREGYETAKNETPHDGSPPCTADAHEATSPTPGLEPGMPQTAAAHDPYPDHPPRLARSSEEIEPAFLNAIAEQGWRRGMKEGRREARKESRKESRMEGREEGFREGLEAGKRMGVLDGREQGFKEGKLVGLKNGRALVLAEVHNVSLLSTAVQTAALHSPAHDDASSQTDSASCCADFAVQTNPIPTVRHSPTPMHFNSTTQTADDYHIPINHCIHTVVTEQIPPTQFSWADDADSLPISPASTPRALPPRDFSVLRSDSVTLPFGSLQRRARRSHRRVVRAPQSRWSRCLPSSKSSWHSSACDISDLDWERDPRLSELGRVLQGLGWVHSSVG